MFFYKSGDFQYFYDIWSKRSYLRNDHYHLMKEVG